MTKEVRADLRENADVMDKLRSINHTLFEVEKFRGTASPKDRESLSIPKLLTGKHGTCLTLVILYMAVAEQVGVDVHAAATPTHLFVRYQGPEGVYNVETLEGGRFEADEEYVRRHHISQESIRNCVYLSALPDDAVLGYFLSNRAVLASREGHEREAFKDYRHALRLFPDLVVAFYNRGLLELQQKEPRKAARDFTQALEIDPTDAEALNNRGLARMALGDLEGARADFSKALRLRPTLREARENLERVDEMKSP